MKIEQTKITKLLLSDLMGEPHRLDPVTVIIEDLGVRAENGNHKTRQGKIIIECYGKSWSSYWGGAWVIGQSLSSSVMSTANT